MKNRVKELRYVKASELVPDPRNPRRHPPVQRAALQAMLADVGIADAVIARETPEGLVLIDGHLRTDLDPNQTLPVLVTDLDEAEAGKVLVTLDPLAAMVEVDSDALARLIADAAPPVDLMAMFPEAGLEARLLGIVDRETHANYLDPDAVTSKQPVGIASELRVILIHLPLPLYTRLEALSGVEGRSDLPAWIITKLEEISG